MSSTVPARVRVASLLPAPTALADYEPFKPLGSGAFGVSSVADVSATSYADLTEACQRAFAAGGTVGFAPEPRIKAVFFDMDATVIQEESLVELAAHAGYGAHVAEITERAMRGELDFAAALRERVALLKGASVDILPLVAERLTLTRGIQPFVAFCREVGVPTFMISGGFTVIAGVVQRKVGFDGFHANTLGISGSTLSGTVDGAIVDGQGKKRYLLETCARLGVDPKSVAAVGDGANDLPMLKAAGVAVGYRPKPVLLPHVHAVNAAGNHAFLGPLLFGRDVGVVRTRGR